MRQKAKIIIPLIIFCIISLLSIKSSMAISNTTENLLIKQLIWYILGFGLLYVFSKIDLSIIYKNIWKLYWLCNILLLFLLIFAKPINNSKCWFSILGITIQPSEFCKIIIIILLATIINKFNKTYQKHTLKDEMFFLIKIFLIILIPSILTFLEPDTGAVIIYFIITISMLFISGIRKKWFFIIFSFLFISILSITILYYINHELLLNMLNSDMFLRIERIVNWSNKEGYQLTNSILAIGAAGFSGYGIGNTPIYFPESATDFIFSVYASNTGYIGSLFLIAVITYFDISIIKIGIKEKKRIQKYIISGFISFLLYSQFQNISMTFGLMPITGIPLPFISYGGSSLLSNMILLGISLNKKATN